MGGIVALTLLIADTRALTRNWPRRGRFETRAIGGDDLLLSASEVLLLAKQQPSATSKKEGRKSSKRAPRLFSRTNRIDGFVKWVNELHIYRAAMNLSSQPASPVLIVELAKELLWSNMPEQCLEMYAAYCDLILGEQKSTTTANALNTTTVALMPVAPDTKLIQCATRAFIFLGDAKGALKLLQATSRSGLDFDSMTKSLLMSDLAECSPEGFQAALRLRMSMKERRERIHANAYVGLLKGCWMHGLSPRQRGESPLLVDAAEEEQAIIDELGNSFRLTADKAEELALEIAAEYMAVTNRESAAAAAAAALTANSSTNVTANGKRPAPVPTKKNLPVMTEAIRVLFRVAAMRTHSKVLDMNLEVDQLDNRELKAKAGLKYALDVMKKYKLKFTIQIADLLIDECLRIGDVSGVKFVVQRMWNSRLYAKTSTYNTLLKRYAENGDGESAHGLVTKVMEKNEETQPNSETYALLLEACMRTEKGRYYAKEVIERLRLEEGGLRKNEWDSLMELRVMAADPYWPVLLEMVAKGEQPDDRTMTLLMEAFSRTGDRAGALRLHRLQVAAEGRRRSFRKYLLGAVEAAEGDENTQLLVTSELADETMHLPPPSKRSVNCLLEILRDASTTSPTSVSAAANASEVVAVLPAAALTDHEEAAKVLADMCDRASDFLDGTQATIRRSKPQFLPVTFTNSGKLLLAQSFSPDQTTFALVMEACINAGDADSALQTFSRMEAFGLQPDRRVYAALIRSFGLRRDVPSALGVFDEMRRNFAPDVNNLMSILEVCLFDPLDLRLLCGVLEKMSDEGCDLEVYSCDILMQLFPDALTLGAALVDMEVQPVPEGFECTTASLGVIAVLVQAVRKDGGLSALSAAMSFLGSVGIRPDKDTMEYFRIPVAPAPGMPNSRHHNKLLVPHKQRVRSLMDLNMPAEFAPSEIELPVYPSAARPKTEPYFEAGRDDWADHARALGKSLVGAAADDDEDEDSDLLLSLGADDGQISASLDLERMLLEGAFDGLDDADGHDAEGGVDILRKGTGPFGEELMGGELQWPDAIAPKPAVLLPIEIQESFLGQARPRAKPADVWTPRPRKVDAEAPPPPRLQNIKPRAPAPGQVRSASSASGSRTRSADFDQDLLALSNGGHGKYSDDATATATNRGRDSKSRPSVGPRPATGSPGSGRRSSRANRYR